MKGNKDFLSMLLTMLVNKHVNEQTFTRGVSVMSINWGTRV